MSEEIRNEETMETATEETRVIVEAEPKGIKGFIKRHPFWTGVITATGVGGLIVGVGLIVAAVNDSKTNDFDVDLDALEEMDDIDDVIKVVEV